MTDLGPWSWLLTYGYPLMFAGMVVEGPMTTAAGAFGASLGYFNIWLVFLLSMLGDILPDIFYYSVGYFGHQRIVARFLRFLRISDEKVSAARALLARNELKGLLLFKYAPLLAMSGLILTGSNRMPFRRFLLADILIGIPNNIVFTGIGFLSGQAFASVAGKAAQAEQIGGAILFAAVIFYFFYRRLVRKWTERVQKEMENGT